MGYLGKPNPVVLGYALGVPLLYFTGRDFSISELILLGTMATLSWAVIVGWAIDRLSRRRLTVHRTPKDKK